VFSRFSLRITFFAKYFSIRRWLEAQLAFPATVAADSIKVSARVFKDDFENSGVDDMKVPMYTVEFIIISAELSLAMYSLLTSDIVGFMIGLFLALGQMFISYSLGSVQSLMMKTDREMEKAGSVKDMVVTVKGVKEGLALSPANLIERIKTLETERASLMTEMENLRKAAESRANALENEVSVLREEVKSLKDLLGNV